MRKSLRGGGNVFPAAALALLCLAPSPAAAWKPYTHLYTGQVILEGLAVAPGSFQVRIDTTVNGNVARRWYPVRREIVEALRAQPASFNAGLVGPDGFPDLAYGQAVIHPGETGRWLGYLLDSAWGIQGRGDYAPAEKQKALAFAYGFLIHAAGDVWGHTLVNELAEGVFPSVSEMLDDEGKLGIAVRHVVVEGVAADATPGFDGDRGRRKSAPSAYGAAGGDESDDATPGYAFDVPHEFLRREFILRDAPTPVTASRSPGYALARGPAIGEFLELREILLEHVGSGPPTTLAAALDRYWETLAGLRELGEECGFERSAVDLFRGCASGSPGPCNPTSIDIEALTRDQFVEAAGKLAAEAADEVLRAYLRSWASSIDRGIDHWSELSLAVSRGLFDPQARRNLQNERCRHWGGEADPARIRCEESYQARGTVEELSAPFVREYGVAMLGLPEQFGEALGLIAEVRRQVELILVANYYDDLRPLVDGAAELKDRFDELVNDAIARAIGVDIDQLAQALAGPSPLLCAPRIELGSGPGRLSVPGFKQRAEEWLDDYLGMGSADHVSPRDSSGRACSRLKGGAEFGPADVAAVANTIQLGKLALLDGPALNSLLQDLDDSDAPVGVYRSGDNVMVRAIADEDRWLRSIDDDHAWRADARPVDSRPGGGSGCFPLWDNSALRPAFSRLFRDWENPYDGSHGPWRHQVADQFPALGDAPSPTAGVGGCGSYPPRGASRRPLATALRVGDAPRLLGKSGVVPKEVRKKYDLNGNGKLEPAERERIRSEVGAARRPGSAPVRPVAPDARQPSGRIAARGSIADPAAAGRLREIGRTRSPAAGGGERREAGMDEKRRLAEFLKRLQ